MPSKKFEFEKSQAEKTPGKLAQSGTAARFGTAGLARELPARRPGYHADKHTQEG